MSSNSHESGNSSDDSSRTGPKPKLPKQEVPGREKSTSTSSSKRSETEVQGEHNTGLKLIELLKMVELEPEKEKNSGTEGVNGGLATSKILRQPPPPKLKV